MARLLLRGTSLDEALPAVSQRLAHALELPSAAIELRAVDGDERRVALPLDVGTLLVPAGLPPHVVERLRERVVPALEAILGAAIERDALLREVVETSALRRSDDAQDRAAAGRLARPALAADGDPRPRSGRSSSASVSDGERGELVDDIGGEAERLSRLVDNLLDMSRLEARTAEPRVEWCSIEEVILAAVDDVALPAGTFALALDPDLPLIRADAAQLERAFANLLENSARYSGGHPVSVRARAVGPRVLVRVVDRGPGVPAAETARIFEPFYRAPARPNGHRGSGLGLAIVRGFVEANGGRVWVESLPGQGSSFVVELPLERPERERSRPRVLVVDDERQILRALKVILREAGYDVIEAATMEEALDRAAVRPPDAAIVDLMLPDGSGVELSRRLREWTSMPILVLQRRGRGGREGRGARGRRRRLRDQALRPARARGAPRRRAAARGRRRPASPRSRSTACSVDLNARIVRRDGEEIHLTPIEFDLLRALVRHRGRLMTHRSLLVEVWGPQYGDDTQVLRAHIANLRRKIEPPGERRYIRTDAGVGYRFAA